MSAVLSHPTNGSPNNPFSVRGRPYHRKRSSSLCALDDLSLPSPSLSPSVSINFSRDTSVTGEIPIIFEFLTTSSMSSEERISRMASLKPELPPLAKFSPMTAFFPMSDSSGTVNTISTEAFGTRRRGSYYSNSSQRGCSMLSDGSVVYSPLSTDFGMPSPTEAISHEAQSNSENLMASSMSMPSVRVQDYDVGQKKLGDISNFTISAYLDSPSTISFKSLAARTRPMDTENLPVSPQGLLSLPDTPDVDDKTPTQSTFSKRVPVEHHEAPGKPATSNTSAEIKCASTNTPMDVDSPTAEEKPSSIGNTSLSAPPSPDYDDETPTQATFLQSRHQAAIDKAITPAPPVPLDSSPPRGSTLTVPFSPDFDDKTPTQSTFLKRQPESPTKSSAHLDGSSEKPLPAEPIEEEEEEEEEASDAIFVGPPVKDATLSPYPIARNPLPVPCLKHAQWLRDTVVELWIDQEGFRAIRPKFFLASVSNGLPYSQDPSYGPPPPSGTVELTEEHDPLFTTVAEFLPVSRAAHYFHHATFDRAPTLHRITTGDETKDYISRAATVGLRENGVFFVHGTEDHRIDGDRPLSLISTSSTSSYSHPYSTTNAPSASGGRIIRLNWRFEYFVSSRRPDGRSAHRGEKVITPLSFSCTPALLDRSRANKVTVLHIMKKTLLPKLIAQKLEPPDFPTPMLERMSGSGAQTQTCASMSVASLASLLEECGYGRPVCKVVSPTKGSRTQKRRRSGSTSTSASEQAILPTPAPTPTLCASAVKGAIKTAKSTPPTTIAATPTPFNPPRLKTPPRPPLPYTKHRRGSHSDTTPEDYMRQRQRQRQWNGCDGSGVPTSNTNINGPGTHERSRSACSFVRGPGTQGPTWQQQQPPGAFSFRNHASSSSHIVGNGNGNGGGGAVGGGIFGPIIPKDQLMKMLDNSEAQAQAQTQSQRSAANVANASADVRRPHSIRVEVVDNVPVTTLPAPPRHNKPHP